MLLVVDHQQNYSYVMEDDVNISRSIVCSIARNFAIKHKGKLCEFNKATNGKEQGRVVGYNTRNGLVIVRVHKDFGWHTIDEPEDILVYTKFRIDRYSFYYVHPGNLIINEQNVRKLSSKTSK